ncbi:hypothetical protein [Dysgonomonas reticulitermitis]
MNTLHLSRKWVWISTSAIGAGSQVSSLRDFWESELPPVRKLKHTVNKVLSLRDLDLYVFAFNKVLSLRDNTAETQNGVQDKKICVNPFNLRYLRAKNKK